MQNAYLVHKRSCQLMHPCSLIRVFGVCTQNLWTLEVQKRPMASQTILFTFLQIRTAPFLHDVADFAIDGTFGQRVLILEIFRKGGK